MKSSLIKIVGEEHQQWRRFFQVDAMATSSHNLTPYHYAGNNPVGSNDPTGLWEKSPFEADNPVTFGNGYETGGGTPNNTFNPGEDDIGQGGGDMMDEMGISSSFTDGVSEGTSQSFVDPNYAGPSASGVAPALTPNSLIYYIGSNASSPENEDAINDMFNDSGDNNLLSLYENDDELTISVNRNFNLVKTPTTVGDLGQTGINTLNYSYTKDPETGEYSLTVTIDENLNSQLAPGGDLLDLNPGLDIEVTAHEDVHVQQFRDALNSSNILDQMNSSNLTGQEFDDFVGGLLKGINSSVADNPQNEINAQTNYTNYLPAGYQVQYNSGSTPIIWKK